MPSGLDMRPRNSISPSTSLAWPGVVVVKNEEKMDGGIPLLNQWLVQDQLGWKNGTQDASGLSDLRKSKSNRKREPGIFVEDRKELYRSSLTVAGTKKFRDFCIQLKLHRHFGEGGEKAPFVGQLDSYFLGLILRFDNCPSCFRGCCQSTACPVGGQEGSSKKCQVVGDMADHDSWTKADL